MTEWIASPVVTLDTKLGPVQATFCGDYVSVRTDAHVNDNKPALTWRGNDYLVHFFLFEDKDWGVGDDRHHSHVTQRANWNEKHRFQTPTLFDALEGACIEAVKAHIAEHPEVVAEGKVAKITQDLSSAERDLAEVTVKYNAAHEKVNGLVAALHEAKGALANA